MTAEQEKFIADFFEKLAGIPVPKPTPPKEWTVEEILAREG